jgi:N-methylhydantoinase A
LPTFIAVDTGGTFTDLVSFRAQDGDVRFTKSLTTHEDPIIGIMRCLEKVDVALDDAVLFKHGTTHVINTLLERSGPKIALVTTKGFRDVLEFGRGNRTEPFNLFYRYDTPLVPRDRRFEISERIDGKGRILEKPNRAEVIELSEKIRASGASGVAIFFINSYLVTDHEQQVAGWLRDLLPDCYISTSAELTREWYEFERSSTVAANVYTGPTVGRYVAALDKALQSKNFPGRFLLMGSNGGLLSPKHSAAAPVLLVESGPVGGCIGAGAYGRELGFPNLIAFDMGGTTAKCALVLEGRFEVASIYHAGGYGRGIPIRAPVVDIVEVGAGGGSIAWVDDQNQLHVGPRSAGSNPGPVAYSLGGTEPTVTDANLVLGRLDPSRFQGGEMPLDVAAAASAIRERLANRLGYQGERGVLEMASGILAIASVKMSEAIKRITVQRGRDPHDFALMAYGGGGPLHGIDLARELGIPTVIIPPEAGNFSAIGMLLADIRRDDARTFRRQLNDDAMQDLEIAFSRIETELAEDIRKDFGPLEIVFSREAEMRFVGQFHTVRIAAQTKQAALLKREFLNTYRSRYGHAIDDAPVEIMAVHCSAAAATPKPSIKQMSKVGAASHTVQARHRDVFFSERGGHLKTAVYARGDLPVGFAANGPAVIEEYGRAT